MRLPAACSAAQAGTSRGGISSGVEHEKIVIYDDGQPYSFFFEEYTPYGRGICGGIILHGAEDLAKAQYSVHT